jgi:molybdopterin molybdotransferase
MTQAAEAEALILAQMPRFPARQEPLAACGGRVLAEDIQAERDQPPFDRVTMDGIAIAYRDLAAGVRSYEVVGTQAAGAEPLAVAAAQCVEVMTGTALPLGADTVVPVERVQRSGAPSSSFIGAAATARKAASCYAPALASDLQRSPCSPARGVRRRSSRS